MKIGFYTKLEVGFETELFKIASEAGSETVRETGFHAAGFETGLETGFKAGLET